MADKPTYEELEQRVREIEKAESERKQAEEALKESKTLLEKTFASLDEAIFVVDPNTRTIVNSNPAMERIFGYSQEEVIGRNTEFLHVDQAMYEDFGRELFPSLNKSGVYHAEFQMRHKDGSVFYTGHTVTEILDDSGHRAGVVSVVKDITERVQAEEELMLKTKNLEEVNTAMKVLLEHMEQEKVQKDRQMISYLEKLVFPYINKLKARIKDKEQNTYIDIIKSNLASIVTPRENRTSLLSTKLTSTEMEVADLLKQGKSSKEIANFLRVSIPAVSFHRKNIRKKLGLANKKVNLKAYLRHHA